MGLFGTDGIRGRWGTDLTPELLRRVGASLAVLERPMRSVLIGRDTRASGTEIERELVVGLQFGGTSAYLAGVLPTAAVAALIPAYGFDGGIVVSASHNPADDNGIKILGRDGMKLSDDAEAEIERIALRSWEGVDWAHLDADPEANAEPLDDAEERYVEFLLRNAPSLRGLRVVVDCANGAAYRVAPEALRRAGAEVDAINIKPDGRNINDGCGSTHPEMLQKRVVEMGAHLGLAHDGDADRLIAVDEHGEIIDGDQVLAICALDRKRRGILAGNAVVTTVMANLGFHQAMQRHGIEVLETAVGDRYVLEMLLDRGLELGGEQSGHLIFLDRHTTGDGIVTALALLDVLVRADVGLAELATVAPRLPQVLLNVRVNKRDGLDDAAPIWEEVQAVKAELGEHGRVLIRASGTEAVVRVMVQAEAQPLADASAKRLADVVRTALS